MKNSNEKILSILKKYTHNKEVREVRKELIKQLHGSELCGKSELDKRIHSALSKSKFECIVRDLVLKENSHSHEEYSHNPSYTIKISVLIDNTLWYIDFKTSGTVNAFSRKSINQYYVSDYDFKFNCEELRKYEEYYLRYGTDCELAMIDFVFDRVDLDISYDAGYKNYEILERGSGRYEDCLSGKFKFKNYDGKIYINRLIEMRKNVFGLLQCNNLSEFCDKKLDYSEEKITWKSYGL